MDVKVHYTSKTGHVEPGTESPSGSMAGGLGVPSSTATPHPAHSAGGLQSQVSQKNVPAKKAALYAWLSLHQLSADRTEV